MRVGFALANVGPLGTTDNLIRIAQPSLWAVERLLWRVKPQSAYPVTPDGLLPEVYKHVLDPLESRAVKRDAACPRPNLLFGKRPPPQL